MTPLVWPWAVSTTTTSTLASTSAAARSRTSGVTPRAAPTRSRPSESLQAFGYLICFWMSLTVMRPFRLKSLSTTRSFSTLWRCRISLACSRVVPTGTVIRSSLVMSSATGEVRAGLEAQVAVGEDAHELRAHGDRHPADAVLGHQVEGVGHPRVGGHGDGVDDHARTRSA